ncbi:uncharacterized protein SCHCODRAFT_02643909 [Schizophyllum commune H4-8]|uniref:Expressed protein n=1 Tax=Schizophyllum commune (strain H4-8 / FGSC 9210) TaxID=578458 RepID=D8QJY8_SCHCM|nr:uncharacterized protein SCHCODRAFT_02643909 [Schizophyllum commune H4-8]KAI5885624.1 hypothetical protein SCHCODRAFT_02643909 [Schizophyllum commune H4-8]
MSILEIACEFVYKPYKAAPLCGMSIESVAVAIGKDLDPHKLPHPPIDTITRPSSSKDGFRFSWYFIPGSTLPDRVCQFFGQDPDTMRGIFENMGLNDVRMRRQLVPWEQVPEKQRRKLEVQLRAFEKAGRPRSPPPDDRDIRRGIARMSVRRSMSSDRRRRSRSPVPRKRNYDARMRSRSPRNLRSPYSTPGYSPFDPQMNSPMKPMGRYEEESDTRRDDRFASNRYQRSPSPPPRRYAGRPDHKDRSRPHDKNRGPTRPLVGTKVDFRYGATGKDRFVKASTPPPSLHDLSHELSDLERNLQYLKIQEKTLMDDLARVDPSSWAARPTEGSVSAHLMMKEIELNVERQKRQESEFLVEAVLKEINHPTVVPTLMPLIQQAGAGGSNYSGGMLPGVLPAGGPGSEFGVLVQ